MTTRNFIVIAFSFFSMQLLNAQETSEGGGIIFGFGGGYGVGTSRTIIGYNSEENNVNNTYYKEGIKGSYGKGANFNVYGGYMLTNVIGLELAANYLAGSPYTFTNVDIDNITSITHVNEIHATSFRLIPGIRLGYGEKKLRVYSRVALAFGLMNKMIDNHTRTTSDPAGTDILYESFEYTGGKYVGFTGSFGLTYSLSEHISLYGELSRYFISWGAKYGEYTEVKFNDADQLGNMTTSEKKFEYVERVDQTMNQNSGEPTKALRSYVPLNTLSVSLGLHFNF
ncbi:MAG: outer membrane beta-barrel protein [Bacteroidia bacterium]